jgi:hypothetical protein
MTQDSHSTGPMEPDDQIRENGAGADDPATETTTEPGLRSRPPEAPKAPPREALRRPPPAPAPAPPASKLQPSWLLSASGEQLTREEILARYRRQRGLPDDPFENGARPVAPPGYRDRIMTEPRSARFVERPQREPAGPPPRQPRAFTMGQTLAIAAATALVAGGGAGLVGARFSHLVTSPPSPALAQPPQALSPLASTPAPELQTTEAAAVRDTVIDKKPIATATLQVADVTGETNSFIPLALHAEPGGLEKDILLKISGVPEGAYLTSGHRQDDQVWALSLAETKNVKLVVPRADTPQIDLAVAAFEPRTGELAAPVKTMTVALKDVVVEPTSAPPPGGQGTSSATGARATLPGAGSASLPVPIPAPQSVKLALATPETAETQQLIVQAEQLFRRGEVQLALRRYERAWGNDGSATAAFGIARSYDPLVLASLARSNGVPDRDQAIQWYQRAASGGNPDAAEAIIRLQMKP